MNVQPQKGKPHHSHLRIYLLTAHIRECLSSQRLCGRVRLQMLLKKLAHAYKPAHTHRRVSLPSSIVRFFGDHFVGGTKHYKTHLAQGFKGGRGQKLTKKQKRLEAMRNNKSPGVRSHCLQRDAFCRYCEPLHRPSSHSLLVNSSTSYFRASV